MVYGLSEYLFMDAIVFNSQKNGPILHELTESLCNPFKQLRELPGNLLLVSMYIFLQFDLKIPC